MYVHGFRLGGGSVTCPDVIVVGSRKGMLGGRTTIFFLVCLLGAVKYAFIFRAGRGSLFVWDGGPCGHWWREITVHHGGLPEVYLSGGGGWGGGAVLPLLGEITLRH